MIDNDTNTQDIWYLANNLRALDVREICDSHGTDPFSACKETLDNSVIAKTLRDDDGNLVACMGVTAENAEGVGILWLLGTPWINKHRAYVAMYTKRWVRKLLRNGYKSLGNWIACYHHDTCKWLTWLGAEFGMPEPIGRNGALFRPFLIKGD